MYDIVVDKNYGQRLRDQSGQLEVLPSWPPLICLAMAGAWGATLRNFLYDLEASYKVLIEESDEERKQFTLLGLPWCSCN